MPSSPYPMLAVDDALEIVLAHAAPLPSERVPLTDALNRVLADDVHATGPLPPFPASIKDGYAVIAADGPGDYPVIGEATAGRLPDFVLQPGQVAYITTGAPVPAGADAVVMVEETEPQAHGRVRILAQAKPGQDIRPVGVDVAAGELVLRRGEHLHAAEIGLLATVGVAQASVYSRPLVALLSTGDELVEPQTPLGPGQIRDSNRYMLMAAVQAAGGIPFDLGISGDSQAHLARRIQNGLRDADVLLTSGGVSMGDLDLIKPILEASGTVHFGRIRMKPGKPLTFATVQMDGRETGGGETGGRSKLVFGLPGNPVSSLVTFYLMAVPALRKMAGWPDPHLARVHAHLAQPLPLDPERPEYHRATLTWAHDLNDGAGGWLATSTGSQASSRLLSMRTANALLELPQREGALPAGAVVGALLIG